MELFRTTKSIEKLPETVSKDLLYERMLEVDKKFNALLTDSRKIDYIITTRLDEVEFDVKIDDLRKDLGVLSVIIENLLLSWLESEIQVQQYSEMMALLKIRNVQLNGLCFSLQAVQKYEIEEVESMYYRTQKSFDQAEQYSIKFSEKLNTEFSVEKSLSEAAKKFASLQQEFLRNNPGYFADELEKLEFVLKDLTDARAITLKKQVIRFYNLGTSMMFILEEMRKKHKFEALEIQYERIPFYTQEIKEDFSIAKHWLKDIEDKFRNYQKNLMSVHCGQVPTYLESFRTEFQRRHSQAKEDYDQKISQYVSTTLSDFAIEIDDDFEIVDLLVEEDAYQPDQVVERFDTIKFNMQALGDTIKNFLFNLLDESFEPDLRATHTKDIVQGLSERHAVFDKKIYNFIDHFIERFVNERNKKQMQIEQQKQLFNRGYLPYIKELVDTSYTIDFEEIPTPLFMEILTLSTKLELESENRVVLLIENSSSMPLKNVGITFFVPNTFMIKRRIVKVGKLKPFEKKNVDTEFVPTEEGKFKIMAMVNYNHANDSFWMPSIQIPIVVGNPEKQDEKLNKLYAQFGIEPEKVEQIKKMDQEEYKEEFEDLIGKYPHLAKIPDGTVEKERLIKVLKEVEDIEGDIQDDSFYEEEPYSDMDSESKSEDSKDKSVENEPKQQ